MGTHTSRPSARGRGVRRGRTRAGRVRRQPGFVRAALLLFVVLGVVGVVLLDLLSVYTAHSMLGRQTRQAAKQAAQEYARTANDDAADTAAAQYLTIHGSTMVKFAVDHVDGNNTFTVTARRAAKTYFFGLLTHLPKLGSWVSHRLHPQVTGSNQ